MMSPSPTGRQSATADEFADDLQHRLEHFRGLIFVAMLASLCLMFFEAMGTAALRAVFMLHLGLFILWQPLIERQRALSGATVAALSLAVLAATMLLNAWVLLLWTLLLAGFVGGKVLLAGSLRRRLGYLLALGTLVIVLLLFAVPQAVPLARIIEPVRWAGVVALPILMALVFVLGQRAGDAGDSEVLDLVNGVVVMLLLSVLVLGSLATMLLFQVDYVSALLQTLFGLAGVLLLLGWLWNPHFGFSGLQNVFSRYLLSLGMPAQQWLQALADLTQRESDPVRFLSAACSDMATRAPWIRGLAWRLSDAANGIGVVGQASGEVTTLRHPGVEVSIYTRYPLPPAIAWNLNLLVQLLAEFYADKQRALRLNELSYLRAVHETGARLTHDVKNLLQSLQTLIYAAEHAQSADPEAFRTLMRRQLPAITVRLATTLEKLRTPGDTDPGECVAVRDWWQRLCQRYALATRLHFEAGDIDWSVPIPESVYSAVADNAIANGTDKRANEPDLQQTVRLDVAAGVRAGIALTICDNGTALPNDIAGDLFQRPLPSDNGLGIGLYQAARLAESAGYRLELAENQPGRVCIRLSPV